MGLYFAHRYDQAIEQLRKTLELEPSYWLAHAYLGHAYEQTGHMADAISEFEKAAQLESGTPEIWSNVAHAFAVSGQRNKAQNSLGDLGERFKNSYVPPYNIAVIYAGLDDKDEAIALLEKAYAERSLWMTFLRVDAQLDPLRSDPRFADLLRRMGFPQ